MYPSLFPTDHFQFSFEIQLFYYFVQSYSNITTFNSHLRFIDAAKPTWIPKEEFAFNSHLRFINFQKSNHKLCSIYLSILI